MNLTKSKNNNIFLSLLLGRVFSKYDKIKSSLRIVFFFFSGLFVFLIKYCIHFYKKTKEKRVRHIGKENHMIIALLCAIALSFLLTYCARPWINGLNIVFGRYAIFELFFEALIPFMGGMLALSHDPHDFPQHQKMLRSLRLMLKLIFLAALGSFLSYLWIAVVSVCFTQEVYIQGIAQQQIGLCMAFFLVFLGGMSVWARLTPFPKTGRWKVMARFGGEGTLMFLGMFYVLHAKYPLAKGVLCYAGIIGSVVLVFRMGLRGLQIARGFPDGSDQLKQAMAHFGLKHYVAMLVIVLSSCCCEIGKELVECTQEWILTWIPHWILNWFPFLDLDWAETPKFLMLDSLFKALRVFSVVSSLLAFVQINLKKEIKESS